MNYLMIIDNARSVYPHSITILHHSHSVTPMAKKRCRVLPPHLHHIYTTALILIDTPYLSIRQTKLLRLICNRQQIRMCREVKRSMCRQCTLLMVPGVSCDSDVYERKGYRMRMHCWYCGHVNEYYAGTEEV